MTLAAASGDENLVERDEHWQEREFLPVSQHIVAHVTGMASLARARPEHYLRCLDTDTVTVPMVGLDYRRIVSALITAGQADDARRHVDCALAHVEELRPSRRHGAAGEVNGDPR